MLPSPVRLPQAVAILARTGGRCKEIPGLLGRKLFAVSRGDLDLTGHTFGGIVGTPCLLGTAGFLLGG